MRRGRGVWSVRVGLMLKVIFVVGLGSILGMGRTGRYGVWMLVRRRGCGGGSIVVRGWWHHSAVYVICCRQPVTQHTISRVPARPVLISVPSLVAMPSYALQMVVLPHAVRIALRALYTPHSLTSACHVTQLVRNAPCHLTHSSVFVVVLVLLVFRGDVSDVLNSVGLAQQLLPAVLPV